MTSLTDLENPSYHDIRVRGDPVLYAYLAGFFDGEGTIYIYDRSDPHTKANGDIVVYNYKRLGITVGNNDKSATELFRKTFRGSVVTYSATENTLERYLWKSTDWTAAQALRKMLPYLRTKQKRAQLAIELQRTMLRGGDKKGLPPDIIEKRNELHRAIQAETAKFNLRARRRVEAAV